jgi:hypothetical protein
VIVDTESLVTSCLPEADPRSFSRFNLLSATLTASLARRLVDAGAPGVGVVCPYRAQARLLDALLREAAVMRAATTHRFQGSERDAVLLDLTDADPQEGPSLLTGRDSDLALRLLNVGVSRARGKLLLIADVGFLRDRHPPTSPTRALLELAEEEGAVTVDASQVVSDIGGHEQIRWAANWEMAIADLLDRPLHRSTELDVSVASPDQAGAWLDHVARELPALGHVVTVRAPAPIAARLESAPVELRLRTLGPAPIAFLGEAAMAVGSADPAKPAVCVAQEAVIAAARRRLLAD